MLAVTTATVHPCPLPLRLFRAFRELSRRPCDDTDARGDRRENFTLHIHLGGLCNECSLSCQEFK